MKILTAIVAVLTILSMPATKAHAQLFDAGNYKGQFSYSGLTSDVLAIVDGNLQGSSGSISGIMVTPWDGGGGFVVCEYSQQPSCGGLVYDYPSNDPSKGCLADGPSFAPFFCKQIGGTRNICKENISGTWESRIRVISRNLMVSMHADLGVDTIGQTGVCPSNRPSVLQIDLLSVVGSDCSLGALDFLRFGICDDTYTVVAPSNAGLGNPITGHFNFQ